MRNSLTLIFCLLIIGTANAQWNTDTLLRTRICRYGSSSAFQTGPVICRSDSSSYLIFWQDSRNNQSIYGQRADSAGYLMWDSIGVSIRGNLSGNQPQNLAAFPDGIGGAIVIYYGFAPSSTEIRAQRVDKNGNILWGTNGLFIRGNIASDLFRQLSGTLDNNGNLIMSWLHSPFNATPIVEAQKIDTSGNKLWGINGVIVTPPSPQFTFRDNIVHDNNNGAFIYWIKNSDTLNVQHLDSNGNKLFINPVALAYHEYSNLRTDILSDGKGGVFIGGDNYYSNTHHIYAYHIDYIGNKTFTTNGINLTSTFVNPDILKMLSDDNGGMFVCWEDVGVNYTYSILKGLRIDSLGNNLLGNTPIILCTDTTPFKDNLALASDSSGGAFIIWADKRYGYFTFYGQHFDGNANLLWRPNGYPVCAANMNGVSSSELSFKLIGKLKTPVVTWRDTRITNPNDRVYATDVLDAVATYVNEIKNDNSFINLFPNPASDNFTITFNKSVKHGTAKLFNTIGELLLKEPISNESKKEINLKSISTGIYLLKVFDGENYYCKKLIVERD
jgi:hypothetical protein